MRILTPVPARLAGPQPRGPARGQPGISPPSLVLRAGPCFATRPASGDAVLATQPQRRDDRAGLMTTPPGARPPGRTGNHPSQGLEPCRTSSNASRLQVLDVVPAAALRRRLPVGSATTERRVMSIAIAEIGRPAPPWTARRRSSRVSDPGRREPGTDDPGCCSGSRPVPARSGWPSPARRSGSRPSYRSPGVPPTTATARTPCWSSTRSGVAGRAGADPPG